MSSPKKNSPKSKRKTPRKTPKRKTKTVVKRKRDLRSPPKGVPTVSLKDSERMIFAAVENPTLRITKAARYKVQEISNEFIAQIYKAASELANSEKKKTVLERHVEYLGKLGKGNFCKFF